jgi:hypothetical protein
VGRLQRELRKCRALADQMKLIVQKYLPCYRLARCRVLNANGLEQ